MKQFLRNFKLTFAFVVFVSIGILAQQKFYINLNDRSNDTFKVTLFPENLTDDNNIFQFASTAPGTYQIMDIGRFVKSFNAFDEDGDQIDVEKISTNQWEIDDPEDVYKIIYTISETWDTPVETNKVYPMAGTSIEDDHVLINGHAVFGYFKGKQSDPIYVKLEYPEEWIVGTALKLNKNGYYEADTYDHIVDSPILLGNLTKAVTKIANTDINVYTYSKTGLIKSDELLSMLKDILDAEKQFIKKIPVKHYDFLFHFEDFTAGAWEHSYSSEYIYKEEPLSEKLMNNIRSVVAHEFFHIVTPLNIHSELVEKFNFIKPVMSQHLWLYEGITEWASGIMQLRGGLITLEDYLKEISQKLKINDFFKQDISLTELGKRATELPQQYANIYMKGSVTGTLMDIRLLDLSDGKKGLRELIIELTNKYGKHKSFSENNFFNELVAMTYPEMDDFINKYIKNTEPLPVKEYFDKLGVNYYESKGVDSSKISLGIRFGVKGQKLFVSKSTKAAETGILEGDIIEEIGGTSVTLKNARSVFVKFSKLKVGDSIDITVTRGDKKIKVVPVLTAQKVKHAFEINPNATEKQIKFRKAWMKNF
ncbi:MAG: peptidase [Bacteroidetes bacterium]|nr:peptidase [Bacteroidota bacterium]